MYELLYSAQQRNILNKSNVLDENINNNRHFVVIHSDYKSRDLKHRRNNTLPANWNVGNLYTRRKHIRNPFIVTCIDLKHDQLRQSIFLKYACSISRSDIFGKLRFNS